MRVRLTQSASQQLFAEVVRLRSRDREEAARFVLATSRELGRLETQRGGPEIDRRRIAEAPAREGHSFYYRIRGDTLWVLAMAPRSSSPPRDTDRDAVRTEGD